MEKFMVDQGYSAYGEIVGCALPNLRPAAELVATPGAPLVDLEHCTGCRLCLKPGHCFAITLADEKAVVDPDLCYGCGICVALCPHSALSFASESVS
jgi:dihydropyrimidine dehydrogenase (NAD+) subunit PreA